MARAHATTDHDKIRQWVGRRGADEEPNRFHEFASRDLAGPEDEDDEDDDDDENDGEGYADQAQFVSGAAGAPWMVGV